MVTAGAAFGAGTAAAADQAPQPLSFFHVDPGTAGWTADGQAIAIHATADGGFGGFNVKGVAGLSTDTFPASSFDFSGPAMQGSPRLVVQFSDGGDAALRPLQPATTLTTVDGTGPNWETRGGTGTCAYGIDWAAVQVCHAGTTINEIYLTTDPLNTDFIIDNVKVNNVTYSEAPIAPAGNADLQVGLETSPFVGAGQTFTTKVTVTNNGPQTAGPTQTTVFIPGGYTVQGETGTLTPAPFGLGTLDTFVDASVAVGTPIVHPVSVKAPGGFALGFTAAFSTSKTADPNPFNNVAIGFNSSF